MSMGAYSGWFAIALQVLALTLAIRTPAFNIFFNGLKAQLRLHHFIALGFSAALVVHLAVVTLDFAEDIAILFDVTEASLLFGWLAFIFGLIVLVFAFLHGRIGYRHWRWIHLLTVAGFYCAFGHIYLISEPAGWIQQTYFWLPLSVGSAAIITSSVLPALPGWGKKYILNNNTQPMPGVYHLSICPAAPKESIRYQSGHFIYLKFLDPPFTRLWHPFTIISKSGFGCMELLIKDRGRDTHQLDSLSLNAGLRILGPFGTPMWPLAGKQLWIAQGIGIAIFIAGMRSLGENPVREAHLIFCASDKNRIIFENEINQWAEQQDSFTWEAFIGDGYRFVEDLKNRFHQVFNFELIRICGHPGFQRNCQRTLRAMGVAKNQIQLEGLR